MNKRFWTNLLLIVTTIIAMAAISPSTDTAQAGGGGGSGVAVAPLQVCLNGVQFQASAVDQGALYHSLNTSVRTIYSSSPIGVGKPIQFNAVGVNSYVNIVYAPTIFNVGDTVIISVLAGDGSGYGGTTFGQVQNCLLPNIVVTCYTNQMRGDFILVETPHGSAITGYSTWDGSCSGVPIMSYPVVWAQGGRAALAECQSLSGAFNGTFVWNYNPSLWACYNS